ncbi:MAG: response regulator [Anaerolineales bacterium]|nr:response regulator [Anaerolineales bacterium]
MAKILIIDDDLQTTKLLEGIVSLDGHKATAVNNSAHAIETANASNPDLVLLDIMMPGINGIQLCKMFQSTPELKHIPIIIVSALDDIGSKKDAFNAGAKDFLTKPVRPKELSNKISALIEENNGQTDN